MSLPDDTTPLMVFLFMLIMIMLIVSQDTTLGRLDDIEQACGVEQVQP